MIEYDVEKTDNSDCTNVHYLQEQNVYMTYNEGLETNKYYKSLKRKANDSDLKSPVNDINKCLSFDLDLKGQSVVASAWHGQNIYFDPYQTVICPFKGNVKWKLQKPYLPAPPEAKEEG